MKKSICYIITLGEFGGAQRYVFDLAVSLDKNFYNAIVLMGPEKLELKTRLEKAGIQVLLVKNLRRNIHPSSDLKAIFELKKILRELKPDIIHLNSSKAGFLGSLASFLAGIKNVIFTAHGFAYLEPHFWLIRKIYLIAEKIATVFRKKIITVSDFDKSAALKSKLADPEKFITIHNGIDWERLAPLSKETAKTLLLKKCNGSLQASRYGNLKVAVTSPNRLIGTIANFYRTKGLEYLIDAVHILTTSYQLPAISYLIIGEGPERKNLESQIKNYRLQESIFIVGELPEAHKYLSAFDIFVLPSIKEGLPYIILEAAAAGLPIVATAVGGIPEIITPLSSFPPHEGGTEGGSKPAGILVKPKDPQALAQAIKKLIDNPQLAKNLGENAKQAAMKFDLEKMVKETEKVYWEISNYP